MRITTIMFIIGKFNRTQTDKQNTIKHKFQQEVLRMKTITRHIDIEEEYTLYTFTSKHCKISILSMFYNENRQKR